ncbi:MAG: ATP-dependent DNA helicase RecQ [Cytophagaceae bacterium]
MQDIHLILKKYYGYSSFRPLQKEIIESVLSGNDTLALLPTGGGKSVCFQVPALAMGGLCIVISPLIALMKDQVLNLKKKGINAVAVHSGMNKKEIDIALDRCAYDPEIKFLYLSPERLQTDIFTERVKKMPVKLIAVDEAHCISQWGYDFRPHYLQIIEFRRIIPLVPVLALTATATLPVRKDIQQQLGFKKENVFAASFSRMNLSYSAFLEDNKEKKILRILNNVKGSSVIYVRNRKKTKEISDFLNRNKISSGFYHAGLQHLERSVMQESWISNKLRVIVSTNAFGMGIDKPDVRTVIHYDLPETLEAYYQEAGRAGRDGRNSYAVLLFSNKDVEDIKNKIEQAYPSPQFLKRVYQGLANYYKIAVGSNLLANYEFDFNHFIETYNLPKIETYNALKRLEQEGFIQLNEAFYSPSRLHIITDNATLYQFQLNSREYDNFIKILLRLYGGELFNGFVVIHEKDISRQLNGKESEVIKKIEYLQKAGYVTYEKQTDKPQLVFTTHRYDALQLPLNVKRMEERKNNDLDKCKSMIYYATDFLRCRSVKLLEYFGEENASDCGICDVCLEKKKEIAGDFSHFRNFIIGLLKEQPLSPDELKQKFSGPDEKNFIAVLRKLLDNREVIFENGNYRLTIQ